MSALPELCRARHEVRGAQAPGHARADCARSQDRPDSCRPARARRRVRQPPGEGPLPGRHAEPCRAARSGNWASATPSQPHGTTWASLEWGSEQIAGWLHSRRGDTALVPVIERPDRCLDCSERGGAVRRSAVLQGLFVGLCCPVAVDSSTSTSAEAPDSAGPLALHSPTIAQRSRKPFAGRVSPGSTG